MRQKASLPTLVAKYITYTAKGMGRLTSDGKLRFTGSDFLYATSEAKFGHLNNSMGVFEVEVDNQTGDITRKTSEWK